MLLLNLFLELGLVRCKVDHGIFYGRWKTPPDEQIPMPKDRSPLLLIVPLHVDDGLGVTNSLHLYNWFISSLAHWLHIVDLGVCKKFLSVVIIRDRPGRQLWLFSHAYITEILEEWDLGTCKSVKTPWPTNDLDSVNFATAFSTLSDSDILEKYQRVSGQITYLAVTDRPDIAFAAMKLGQKASNPTKKVCY